MFRSIFSLSHKALPFISSDTSLGIPLSATVADLHHGNGWALPNARSENQVLLLSYISTLHLSAGSDQAVWSVNGAKNKEFSSKQIFNAIRRSVPCKIWAPLVWHKASIPRHSTTTCGVAILTKDISLLFTAFIVVWQASIYELWKERNRRSHEGLTQPPASIMRYISETLRDKCSALLSLGHPLGPALQGSDY
ncbi:hypothetical protein YC2023_075961 [Brassica napus]